MSSWQAIRLVAWRELYERVRERSFLLSTAFSILVIGAVALIPAFTGDGPAEFTVGIVGEESQPLGRALETGDTDDWRISTRAIADPEAAREAIEAGDLDAAIVDGRRVIVDETIDDTLRVAVQMTAQQLTIANELAAAGADPQATGAALDPAPLDVDPINPPDPNQDDRGTVAGIGAFLLYGQLFGYGYWVSMGVVEEKASRVVEVILSKVRPSQLLAGKVIGIGVLGFLQLIVISAVGLAIALVTDAIDIPPGTAGTIGLVFLYFIVGYAFYSCLFAVSGALVSRQEDLQTTIMPMSLLLFASFFLAFQALNDPGSTLARVASFIPASAPLTMPQRVALEQASGLEALLSMLLSIGVTALLIPLAGRLYSGAILRMGGQVKLKEAWRSAA
jgi:ABC-2 type transport system permease protein